MLELLDVTKRFGKKQVLRGLTAPFPSGICGLLGPNGAGKTTLMRCLTGQYRLQSGEILFDGKSIRNNRDYQRHLGYLPQKFGVFRELTVKEVLLYFANLKGVEEKNALPMLEEALELVHLTDRRDSRAGTLSGGMVRRLGIAQALLNHPAVLLLDEPTAGLDPEERMRFQSILSGLRQRDCLVLLSTHIVEDVERNCDRVLVMKEGRFLADGAAGELAALADGKIYEVPEECRDDIRGAYEVEREVAREGAQYLRIYAEEEQPWQSVPPAAEDGYFCALKSQRSV